MKWASRLALGLYPAWWRRRYGRELEALVEDSPAEWGDALDIARGAFVMQIKDFRTLPLLGALIGASIGTMVYVRTPALYASSSTIRVAGGNLADANADSSKALRDNLARAVATTPEARGATTVVMSTGPDSGLVKISYRARDPKGAQEAVTRLVAAALSGSGNAVALGTVVEPPLLPTTPKRARGPASVYSGAGLGLLLGVALVALRRGGGARNAA